jgi:hypothetical protein
VHKLSSIVQKLYNYYRRCAKIVQRKCLILLIKLILTYWEPIYKLLILLKFFYYATAISILSFSLMPGTILNLKWSNHRYCIKDNGPPTGGPGGSLSHRPYHTGPHKTDDRPGTRAMQTEAPSARTPTSHAVSLCIRRPQSDKESAGVSIRDRNTV